MKSIAVDVFCGVGGLTEGIEHAGFDVRLAIDSDIYAHMVYTTNHPGTPVLWHKVEKLRKLESPLRAIGLKKSEVSLLVGGPPCQGFSFANRRTNHVGNAHNAMIGCFLRLVREIRPPAVLMESVQGLSAFDGGRVLGRVTNCLVGLGYKVESRILNAADYGVPQFRRRIFIIGSDNDDFEWPAKTHGPEARKPWVTVSDAILGDLPGLKGGGGIRAGQYAGPPRTRFQQAIRQENRTLHDHVTTLSCDRVRRRFAIVPPGSGLFYLEREGKVPKKLRIKIGHYGVYRRLDPAKPSLTITNVGRSMTIHPKENRVLSLREAARLQSFRDSYRFPGGTGMMQQAIGNAVPPFLARAVGLSVSKAIA